MNFQIKEKEIVVTSFDGIKLYGTLTLPEKPKALVIPVHGSFCQDRNGDLDSSSKWMYPEGAPQRKLFFDISNILKTIGVATFRYDKRASGISEGKYEDTTLLVLAKDLNVILNQMRQLFSDIPIIIIGQSEGARVTLKAFDIGTRPDFILLQSPALFPFDKILDHQKTRAAAPFLNDQDGIFAKKYPYMSAFYKAMYEGDMLAKIRNTNEQYYVLKNGQWSAKTSLQKYREYMWDGFELLKKVDIPVTIFFGLKDLNVTPLESSNIIESNKNKGFYQNVSIITFEGLEHSFRKLKEGESFFEALAKPLSPVYIKALKTYILQIIR